MRIASLTICYPSPENPQVGLFVQRRLQHVAELVSKLTVINPLPCLPLLGKGSRLGSKGNLDAWHIPMPRIPRYFKLLDPWWFERSVKGKLAELIRDSGVDILDAHFCYPDGVAVARLAKRFDLPFVITLRGVLPRLLSEKRKLSQVRQALERASAVIAVSGSLKMVATKIGISEQKITVIPNGVDGSLFRPGDRRVVRRQLGLIDNTKMLISVGHICPGKGMHTIVSVLPGILTRYPNLVYTIVGGNALWDGNESEVRKIVRAHRLTKQVIMAGSVPPEMVATWLQAADLFVLSTRREGWCNAIMEALASGLPVVTTNVGGNAEIISNPEVGILVPFGDDAALIKAIEQALSRQWDYKVISDYAKRFTWRRAAELTVDVFRKVLTKNYRGDSA